MKLSIRRCRSKRFGLRRSLLSPRLLLEKYLPIFERYNPVSVGAGKLQSMKADHDGDDRL